MNKQELFKQADYTFQRGNRELAKKYLTEYLSIYPNDEAAWMLMAKIAEEKERKCACYQRVLKINPNNNEAKIGLIRVNSASSTLPLPQKQ
ncbi:MAG: tetratricopeptide repeat protein, partial [Anaerolineales bacterium]